MRSAFSRAANASLSALGARRGGCSSGRCIGDAPLSHGAVRIDILDGAEVRIASLWLKP